MSAELFYDNTLIISFLSLDWTFSCSWVFSYFLNYFSLEGYCGLIMIIMNPFAGVPLAEIYPHKGNHSAQLSCETKKVHIT